MRVLADADVLMLKNAEYGGYLQQEKALPQNHQELQKFAMRNKVFGSWAAITVENHSCSGKVQYAKPKPVLERFEPRLVWIVFQAFRLANITVRLATRLFISCVYCDERLKTHSMCIKAYQGLLCTVKVLRHKQLISEVKTSEPQEKAACKCATVKKTVGIKGSSAWIV